MYGLYTVNTCGGCNFARLATSFYGTYRWSKSSFGILRHYIFTGKRPQLIPWKWWNKPHPNGYGFVTFQTTENPISLFLRKGNFLLLLTFRIPILCNGRFLFSCFVQKPNVSRYIIQQYNGIHFTEPEVFSLDKEHPYPALSMWMIE